MNSFSDEEMNKVAMQAVRITIDIAIKYKINDLEIIDALIDAFQSGARFIVEEMDRHG